MSETTWPSQAKQKKLCQRRDPTSCAMMGAPGCELCASCNYPDEHLAALGIPVDESRANHAKWHKLSPNHCGFCFDRRPRDERVIRVADHITLLYPPEHHNPQLRDVIATMVARMPDAELREARDWTGYEWRTWMDANPEPVAQPQP